MYCLNPLWKIINKGSLSGELKAMNIDFFQNEIIYKDVSPLCILLKKSLITFYHSRTKTLSRFFKIKSQFLPETGVRLEFSRVSHLLRSPAMNLWICEAKTDSLNPSFMVFPDLSAASATFCKSLWNETAFDASLWHNRSRNWAFVGCSPWTQTQPMMKLMVACFRGLHIAAYWSNWYLVQFGFQFWYLAHLFLFWKLYQPLHHKHGTPW